MDGIWSCLSVFSRYWRLASTHRPCFHFPSHISNPGLSAEDLQPLLCQKGKMGYLVPYAPAHFCPECSLLEASESYYSLLGKGQIHLRTCCGLDPQRFIHYILVFSLALVGGTRNLTRLPLEGGVTGGMPMKGTGP